MNKNEKRELQRKLVPFVYFSSRVIKSIPLTLAVLNNALRDVLLGILHGENIVGDILLNSLKVFDKSLAI